MHNSINIKSYSVSLSKEYPRTYIERCALEVFLGLDGSSVVEGRVQNGNAIFVHLRSSHGLSKYNYGLSKYMDWVTGC